MKSRLNTYYKLMQNEKVDPLIINTFAYYFKQVLEGATGLLTKDKIKPPSQNNLVEYDSIDNNNLSPYEKLAVIKLNGGLGTSMGLSKAKSLLKVKDKYNFLDIIALQILHLRKKCGHKIPLLFMNSFNTSHDTLKYLEKYPDLCSDDLPLDFLQNKFPKIRQDNLEPLNVSDELLNWNPPGHGDIYISMAISNILDKLISKGIVYAFVSNSDNLGAIVDDRILNYLDSSKVPLIMEVCDRTEMDKKGGHLAETREGQLILRETAQCPETEAGEFQDVNLYKYFNTNNLWLNLVEIKKLMKANDNIIKLPLILNKKNVDGIKVYQIETAMGSAISLFENSKAVVVPRTRFAPVKKTNELLCIWSDAYKLTDDFNIIRNSDRTPLIILDDIYTNISDFENRFSTGIPSLKDCTYLEISGDVSFGKNVKFSGNVSIKATSPQFIENMSIRGF
ncbi:MAG: UTP--glucose-1-phosphate uridylyltransferase [Candidatus Cloacimonetes bacterium]|nr:UTP--glucose-1-phosphate uridylyltransferase [Candidatus Cloacimonadota bacterium]